MKCAPQWFLFQITLILLFRFLRGRHKGKIQLSIVLPVPTAHRTYPIRDAMCVVFKKKIISTLAKTLSAAYNNSTFLNLHTAHFLMLQKLRGQRKTKKDKAAGEGWEEDKRRGRRGM